MSSFEIDRLIKAASERQVAVQALQKKYASSINIPTEQLVLDMRELLATERLVLDAVITLFLKIDHAAHDQSAASQNPTMPSTE